MMLAAKYDPENDVINTLVPHGLLAHGFDRIRRKTKAHACVFVLIFVGPSDP